MIGHFGSLEVPVVHLPTVSVVEKHQDIHELSPEIGDMVYAEDNNCLYVYFEENHWEQIAADSYAENAQEHNEAMVDVQLYIDENGVNWYDEVWANHEFVFHDWKEDGF